MREIESGNKTWRNHWNVTSHDDAYGIDVYAGNARASGHAWNEYENESDDAMSDDHASSDVTYRWRGQVSGYVVVVA